MSKKYVTINEDQPTSHDGSNGIFRLASLSSVLAQDDVGGTNASLETPAISHQFRRGVSETCGCEANPPRNDAKSQAQHVEGTSAKGTSATPAVNPSIDTATGEAAPADLSSERVKEIFGAIAKKYERFNAVSSFGAYKKWLHKMVAAANISENTEVLDVAGGTGDVTFALARAKKPARIMCTDLVNEMLDVARAHYAAGAAAGVPVNFKVVDAQDMPFEDASFDVVTMAYGIRNMPKREQALSEIYRVLRPGGQLVCLEFSTPPNAVWRGLYHFYLQHMIPFWGGVIAGQRKGFVYLSKSIKAFPDQAGLAALMQGAGFKNVSWENCTGGIAAVHVAHK